jgi:hypothetical protein
MALKTVLLSDRLSFALGPFFGSVGEQLVVGLVGWWYVFI